MNYKKFSFLFLIFAPFFLIYSSESISKLDECSQKILQEGAPKILNQEIITKTDFIFWQQEAQRVINAIASFDFEQAQELQKQFERKKNEITIENLPDGVSTTYQKDLEEFSKILKQFETIYSTDVKTLIEEQAKREEKLPE